MIKHLFLFLIIAVFSWSCANQRPPTGGPKDTTPPQLVASYPENESAFANSKKIILEFDEYFQVNNITQNMYISPYIDNPYTYKVKGKKLLLTFEQLFENDVTYTFFFNNSIKDLNQGNEAKGLRYVFSTGSFIDSMQLDVEVVYPLSKKACNECIVALLKANDTTTYDNSNPLYFAFTNNSGKASLKNIRTADYRLYAFPDKNKNYKHDPNEPLSFSDSLIHFDTANLEATLFMISPDITKQKLLSESKHDNVIRLQFQKGVEKLTFADTTYAEKKLKHWYTDSYNVSIELKNSLSSLYVFAQDSIGVIDTFSLDVSKTDTSKYFIELSSLQSTLKPGETIRIQLSNTPHTIVDSLIYFEADSTIIPNTRWKLDSNSNILSIYTPKDLINITLHIDSAAIRNERIHAKEFIKSYPFYQEEHTGILKGFLKCPNDSTLLELTNNQLKVVESRRNADHFEFRYLPPGQYRIRVKIDSDKNGTWDKGSIQDLQLPEPVIFHNEIISLRKNWEINDIRISCPYKTVD